MWCVTTVNEKWKGRARNDLYWLRCGFSQHNWSISWREISHKTKMIIWNMWRWNITHLWPILCCVNIQTYKITKLQKTRNLQNTWSEWTLLLPSLPTTFCLVFSSVFILVGTIWQLFPSFPPAVPSFCETKSALEFGKPSTEKLNLKVVDQVQPKHFNPIGTRWDNFQN